MRKKWWIIVAVVMITVVGYAGFSVWQSFSARRAMLEASAEETAVVERGTLRVTVNANGSLAPNDEVALAFLSGGQVAEVLVEVGDVVQAGDVLARLDDADARQAVTDAELQVTQAEINLTSAQIEAEAGLAQANLDAAQLDYESAVAHAAHTGDQLTSARVKLEQAIEALADAQEAYDNAWDSARDWELNIRWKKDALENEREATERNLEKAKDDLEIAQASYNLAVVGIDDSAVQDAEIKVINAQVGLANEPIKLQQAELSLAQAQLKLDSALRALEETTLVAPVDGTVTALNIQAGEMAGGGQTAVVLSDLATLVVDINLDETDVAQIGVGQKALVILDAFPDVELSGEVTAIAPVAQTQSGVVLYPVTVQLALSDPSASSGQAVPVRAGMTADVEIVTASKEDALIVPLRAIRSVEGQSFVLRQSTDAGFEPVQVGLGIMTETEVEITSGLAEGDVVSVVAASSQGSNGEEFGPMRMFGGGGGH